jgi:hypothetical protein
VKIVPLPRYEKQIGRLVTTDERMAMELSIAAQPLSYPVMPQTGGCRKARWARGNRGKSGGIRAVFYYYVIGDTVYMIDAYPKNEKENLTDAEKSNLKKLSKAIERGGVQLNPNRRTGPEKYAPRQRPGGWHDSGARTRSR